LSKEAAQGKDKGGAQQEYSSSTVTVNLLKGKISGSQTKSEKHLKNQLHILTNRIG